MSNEFKRIVLDLDGTLICNVETEQVLKTDRQVTFRSYDDYEDVTVISRIRPFVYDFLKEVEGDFEVGIWSVAQPKYVHAVLEEFDIRPSFVKTFCDCLRKNYQLYKPLSWIEPVQCSFIVEDQQCHVYENDPCIIVPTFDGREDDVFEKMLSVVYNFDKNVHKTVVRCL